MRFTTDMDLRDTYNSIADAWHRDHQTDRWWVGGTDRFIALVGEGATVLDIGCGSGVKVRYLTEHGLRVVGIDFSERMIDLARKETPDSELYVMDMRDLSSLARTFDGIFAQASLLHIPKKDAARTVAHWATYAKPGGYTYCAVKERRAGGPEEEVKVENDYGYPYKRFFSYFTVDEVQQYLTGAGCEVVYSAVEQFGNVRWVQVIGRKE